MPSLRLQLVPQIPALGLLAEAQLCYVLIHISADAHGANSGVNWAFVADASRSMRVPIVNEAQFRELLRDGQAQEVVVDGVPVWQLTAPVPEAIRAAAPNALEYVGRALHTLVERLDAADRFALIACAEDATLLVPSTAGSDRMALARGIADLRDRRFGEETNLAHGVEMGLQELERSRDNTESKENACRLVLLTDGFTQRPDECLRLAGAAAAKGIAISTLGLGGEFQEDVLTAMADRSAGRAVFVRQAEDIPQAVAAELASARTRATRNITLHLTLYHGTLLRRATAIRPTLRLFDIGSANQANHALRLGDIAADTPTTLLLECIAPPLPRGIAPLALIALSGDNGAYAATGLSVSYEANPPPTPPTVLAAAERATTLRLHLRALHAASSGDLFGAIRLFQATAARLDALGEFHLAELAREQAANLQKNGAFNPITAKELVYATRRLGEDNSPNVVS